MLSARFLAIGLLLPALHAELPLDAGELVMGSGRCASCHDSVNGIMIEDGENISPVELWRSSMMANAVRDPLWQAKVREETLRHPALAELIESKCTRCHAPQGHQEAMWQGAESYSLDEALADPLAADGVSCSLCHLILDEDLDEAGSYSGGFQIDDRREIYGPYPAPFTGPMLNNVGYLPAHSDHTSGSGLCATCHTLFTPYVDDNGEVAGTFAEQTPYLEWKNSGFPEAGMECQSCHMPVSSAAMDIASMPPWHDDEHEPFYKHVFVGGNAWMLELLGANADTLGLNATPAQFQRTRDLTLQSLSAAAGLELTPRVDGDSLEVEVLVMNLSGHKLPTGIPLRRMWIRLGIFSAAGDTLLLSGDAPDGRLQLPQAGYQRHHDVIRGSSKTQIYEGVMGDVNGERTFVLLRAANYLKDNRIPPTGFTADHASYDSVAVFGDALLDPDFARVADVWGSGADRIRYRIPLPADSVRVEASLLFQSVVPEVVDAMSDLTEPTIDHFRAMAAAQGFAPVTMCSAEWSGRPGTPATRLAIASLPAWLQLSWEAVPGAVGYQVYRLDEPFGEPAGAELLAEVGPGQLSMSVSLHHGSSFFYIRVIGSP